MDTRTLELFLHLSQTLHFGRSSEACHISPSSLSRTIKQLETSLGVELFERDNRSVNLTPEGRRLQRYARDILGQWQTFRESLLLDSQHLKGEISIYCSVTASYSFLYKLLSDFRRRHPSIEIKLHTGDPALGISRVMTGMEDISIVARPDQLPGKLAFRRITASPLLYITPAKALLPLAIPKPLALPRDTEDHHGWSQVPMIISEEGLSRDRVDEWFRKRDIKPTIYARVAGHEAIVSMVSLGFGIGVVPKIVLDNSPLREQVKVLSNQPKLAAFEVGLCALKQRLRSPMINAFWQQVSELDNKGADGALE